MPAREDESTLRAYVDGGGYCTMSERLVYTACIRDGLSLSRAAAALGVGYCTVRYYLATLRARIRRPDDGRARRAREPAVMAYSLA